MVVAAASAAAVVFPPVLTVASLAFLVLTLAFASAEVAAADASLDVAPASEASPDAALASEAFPDAAPCWTTTQLPKPPAVVNETRHLSPVAPPVQVVPAGSCT